MATCSLTKMQACHLDNLWMSHDALKNKKEKAPQLTPNNSLFALHQALFQMLYVN